VKSQAPQEDPSQDNPAKETPTQAPDDDETLPTFSEQLADQLGGVRGMIETSVPVIAFVIANLIWGLNPGVLVAVATALAIGAYRLSRRQSVRHAVNGLVGIGIGAFIAWRTGNPTDFYLPGILIGLGYVVAMVASVAVRRPVVGWVWSVVADRGSTRWRDDLGLRRTFAWLTLVWASMYLAKAVLQVGIYFADALTEDQKASILGIIRIGLGFPPYALLAALTVWAVRRHLRAVEPVPA
jgi:hypothetical protein